MKSYLKIKARRNPRKDEILERLSNKLPTKWLAVIFILVALILLAGAGCSASRETEKVFRFAGIPDQDAARWAQRYATVSEYLSKELGVAVEAVPSADYSAVVTGFERGDIQMGWFGGLTGVQARLAVPGSEAIAQRPRDANFHSVFVVQADLPVEKLEDLSGLTFTFGSESSTSGHLMPRYFMLEAGIAPDEDLNGLPGYSGSHDKTWKLVESGAYQAGVLNEAVWETALNDGKVDLSKVSSFYLTPPYYDYNWTIRGDIDEIFGKGFKDRVKAVLLAIGPDEQDILDLFHTDSFIDTENDNYDAILSIARQVGIIQ
ncbi:MAG: putative selenate ABC transporter substrate-binding protein [Dehalococcoidales bacterium]